MKTTTFAKFIYPTHAVEYGYNPDAGYEDYIVIQDLAASTSSVVIPHQNRPDAHVAVSVKATALMNMSPENFLQELRAARSNAVDITDEAEVLPMLMHALEGIKAGQTPDNLAFDSETGAVTLTTQAGYIGKTITLKSGAYKGKDWAEAAASVAEDLTALAETVKANVAHVQVTDPDVYDKVIAMASDPSRVKLPCAD